MPIQSLTPPKHQRGSKYDYSDSIEAVREMLANGENPGDGPFDSQGKARSAANALLAAFDDAKEYGARVWNGGDDANPEWFFALKPGRNEYHGRKAAKKAGTKKS